MAATFVVETGEGLENSNSFISVAEADAYFENRSNPDTWTSLTNSDKQKYLRIGTDYIENVYALDFDNRRVRQTQALSWPRINMRDVDGFAIPANVVPNLIKYAVCEAAVRAAAGEDLLPDIDPDVNGGLIRFEKVQVGPISESIQYQGGKTQLKRYQIIESLLEIFVGDSYKMERG